MALYHNADVDSTFGLTNCVGFNLGPGLTVASGDQLVLAYPGIRPTVMIPRANGWQDEFTWSGTTWARSAIARYREDTHFASTKPLLQQAQRHKNRAAWHG